MLNSYCKNKSNQLTRRISISRQIPTGRSIYQARYGSLSCKIHI